jgi:trans-aconitate methyltransferase
LRIPTPDRERWALGLLAVDRSDHVLEIGPGPGASVALIAERLVDGHLVAIDRSAVAVRKTLDRNRAHVEAGLVDVWNTSLENFDGSGGPFDKVLAINVNLFWVQDADEHLRRLAGWMAPKATLCLVYQAPSAVKGREISGRLRNRFKRAGWELSVRKAGGLIGIVAWAPDLSGRGG